MCKLIFIHLAMTLRMTPLVPHDASHDEPAIAERIASAMPLMTPIHRRMGEFVLANPFRAATMRIDELAQAVNASIATANRFAKALGFDGYPAMRAALVRGFEATLGPVERLRSAQEQEPGVRGAAWIDAVFDQAVANIESTRAQLDAADVEAAVEAIVGARRVLILGAGSSAFLTGLMEHGLSVCHDSVQSLALLGGPSHAARRLYTADSRDLVIALAFPRYVKDTIELARRAAARGARARHLRRAAIAAGADRLAEPVRQGRAAFRGHVGSRRAHDDRGADRCGRAAHAPVREIRRRDDRIPAAVARAAASGVAGRQPFFLTSEKS